MGQQCGCGQDWGWKGCAVRVIGALYLVLAGLKIALSISAPEKLALTSSRTDVLLFAVLTALSFVLGFGLLRLHWWAAYLLIVYFALDVFAYALRQLTPLHPWILLELLFVVLVISSPLVSRGMRKH